MSDFVALMGHNFPKMKNSSLAYLAANEIKNHEKFGVDGNENDLANSDNNQLKELVEDLSRLYQHEQTMNEYKETTQEFNIMNKVAGRIYEKILEKVENSDTLDYRLKTE